MIICVAERKTDSDFRSFIEPVDRNNCFVAFRIFEITDNFIYQFRGVSCFNEWFFDDLTSACQLVATRFAGCKAPRIVLSFHLSGMADFQCTCSLPGFW